MSEFEIAGVDYRTATLAARRWAAAAASLQAPLERTAPNTPSARAGSHRDT